MRHAANIGLGQRGSAAPAGRPAIARFVAPAVPFVPRPALPFTTAACPPGYATHVISGQSKCCKVVPDQQGHMVLKCIEKAGIDVQTPCNNTSDCELGEHCIAGVCR